ncbi:cyanophycinase [Pontibacter sp. BT310]|uniref:Cyanophycinase n=1 Tax=Pontibacter populi TaxID=890055 RepID=A0ABS6XF37_9BACT|nr:cyanophycinase [Pontibacter populi]MBJ6119755.1 cyanophycinase [Pontibacter sp. BT310]MBR0572184.1 cyanophycinase [Microvirga sp. STS03]MBW3366608.1 cyanophycinase [Pontibacter populi]
MEKPKGKLIAVGGNEDKGTYPNPKSKKKYYLDFFELGILKRLIQEIPTKNPHIEVITTASLIPEEVGDRYMSAFGILGAENARLMHIRTEEDALLPEYLERISKADGVMMSGGNQQRLTQIFGGTEFLEIMRKRYHEEPFVVAGTSAGAMAMSKIMIKGGSAPESLLRGSVKMSHGLGFIDGVIIDSHFVVRGRFGRLIEAVVTHPKTIGIGLGEDTGVLITEGDLIETIGSNLVVVVDGHSVGYTNVHDVAPGRPISIEKLTMHVLAKGNVYNIENREFFKDEETLQQSMVQAAQR